LTPPARRRDGPVLDLYRIEEPRRGELLTLLRKAGQRGWLQQYRSELPEIYSD